MFTLHTGRCARLVALGGLFLAACASPSIQNIPTNTPALTPYRTASATLPPANPTATSTEPPLPTPTPLTHEIVEGETLLGLAERYGITLDALLAANPDVNPSLLSIGQAILIPQGGAASADQIATPTPAPVEVEDADCYLSAAGELYCFLLVGNPGEAPLENLYGVLRLFDEDGAELANADLVAPLNLLPAGAAMPLTAYIAHPPADWSTARGRLLTAYQPTGVEGRYLSANLQVGAIEIAEDSLSAHLQGSVALAEGVTANTVWVLAVAYDTEGRVVGTRRWESAGDVFDFDFYVYSLGPEIDSVELLVEARP